MILCPVIVVVVAAAAAAVHVVCLCTCGLALRERIFRFCRCMMYKLANMCKDVLVVRPALGIMWGVMWCDVVCSGV